MSAPKRSATIVLAFATALALSSCSDEPAPTQDVSEALMERCIDFGGSYYEYEDTSAGWHIWCVTPDGVDIAENVREGDK